MSESVMSDGVIGAGDVVCLCFFFFKQKTAYEMLRSLVGSEMCIRDRIGALRTEPPIDVDLMSKETHLVH